MTDDARTVTWKATLIGAAMTVASSVAGYVSSHWGGVTSDDLRSTEKRLGVRIDHVEESVARESTSTKEYVDSTVSAAEKRLSALPKKPKKRTTEAKEP